MGLKLGQSVLWEKVSDTELRLVVLPRPADLDKPAVYPDPTAALNFAREHGLDEGSSDEYMREMREGEEE